MKTPKWLYDFIYRYEINAWDIGPRKELVDVIESGRVQPCRTIYLGSGTAKNAIFMAQHGFDVTAVDYVASAIELGRKRAKEAGVDIDFIQDDLTNLRHVTGIFDFLVDFGTLDDLNADDRDLYLDNVLPLTRPGTRFFLWCFEWPSRRLDKFLPFPMRLEPGEVERRFGRWFEIESISRSLNPDLSGFEPGSATYLMTRREEQS
jgi:SAM-dependent methyltransferase